jgi:hypothetical protein
MLGSACGQCQRCLATAKEAIVEFQARAAHWQDRLIRVAAYVVARPHKLSDGTMVDLTDKFKVELYDSLRAEFFKHDEVKAP